MSILCETLERVVPSKWDVVFHVAIERGSEKWKASIDAAAWGKRQPSQTWAQHLSRILKREAERHRFRRDRHLRHTDSEQLYYFNALFFKDSVLSPITLRYTRLHYLLHFYGSYPFSCFLLLISCDSVAVRHKCDSQSLGFLFGTVFHNDHWSQEDSGQMSALSWP